LATYARLNHRATVSSRTFAWALAKWAVRFLGAIVLSSRSTDLEESALDGIATQFKNYFLKWEIAIPPTSVVFGGAGKLYQKGWSIRYLISRDLDGPYLDFYACHRMTNDRHVRLRDNKKPEYFEAYFDLRNTSDEPNEDKRLLAEYHEKNRRIAEILASKGFDK
jgi:hypothetical protein